MKEISFISMCAFERSEKGMDFKMKKLIVIICIILSVLLIPIIVLVRDNVNNYNELNNYDIQESINNQYIQNFDMEYISKDNFDFKIDYVLMDDINLKLVFNFKFNENIEYYEKISLGNLKIVDNENRQIFFNTESDEHYNNYALLNGNWHLVEKNDKIIRQALLLVSNDFPRSEELKISFDTITLYKIVDGVPETKQFNGEGYLNIDISEKLKDRNTIYYKSEISNITNIKLTNSGLTMDIKMEEYTRDMKVIDEKNCEYNIVNIMGKKDRKNKEYIEGEYVVTFDMASLNKNDIIYLIINNEKIKLSKINN